MSRPDLIDTGRISAEIEAEAEELRRQDPEIAELELEIEQAWDDIAASQTLSGTSPEVVLDDSQLLHETASLAALDPRVPIGSRRGLVGIKWLIRKLSYWYVRFLTDQFNVFAGMLIRHLRSIEARLDRVEDAAGYPASPSSPTGLGLLDDPPEPSATTADLVASMADSGPCLVLSGGEGAIVEAIGQRGGRAIGVEPDPERVLAGMQRRLDMRAGDVVAHLAGAEDGEFGTIVLAGTVETLPLRALLDLLSHTSRALHKDGRVVVAVADPANRGPVEAELGSGLGLSPATWRHLLEKADFDARIEPCPDTRITEVVVAQRSPSPLPNHPGGAAR